MDNLYRAPQSNLRRNMSEGLSLVLVEILSSGSLWARMISVVNFISLFFSVLYLLAMVFGFSAAFKYSAGSDQEKSMVIGAIIGVVVFMLPMLLIYWFYGTSMNRYAKIAKQLRQSTDTEADVAQCFASSSTFLKTTGIFVIIMAVIMLLGIAAAIVLPAYQEYVIRARARS